MRKKHFTKQIGLIISEETYNRLVEETDKREVTVSEWVREAIEIRLTKDRGRFNNSLHIQKEGGSQNDTSNL